MSKLLDQEQTICGTGAACERSCPFIRKGRVCPDVQDVEAECVAAGVSLWDVLRGAPLAA